MMILGWLIATLLTIINAIVGTQTQARHVDQLATPAANQLYIADLSQLAVAADPDRRYGVVRVQSVSGDNVVLVVGSGSYASIAAARQAISSGATAASGYFQSNTLVFRTDELRRLGDRSAIYDVSRRTARADRD